MTATAATPETQEQLLTRQVLESNERAENFRIAANKAVTTLNEILKLPEETTLHQVKDLIEASKK